MKKLATHTESEDHPWTINVAGHPPRADSKAYVAARKQLGAFIEGAPFLGSVGLA